MKGESNPIAAFPDSRRTFRHGTPVAPPMQSVLLGIATVQQAPRRTESLIPLSYLQQIPSRTSVYYAGRSERRIHVWFSIIPLPCPSRKIGSRYNRPGQKNRFFGHYASLGWRSLGSADTRGGAPEPSVGLGASPIRSRLTPEVSILNCQVTRDPSRDVTIRP